MRRKTSTIARSGRAATQSTHRHERVGVQERSERLALGIDSQFEPGQDSKGALR